MIETNPSCEKYRLSLSLSLSPSLSQFLLNSWLFSYGPFMHLLSAIHMLEIFSSKKMLGIQTRLLFYIMELVSCSTFYILGGLSIDDGGHPIKALPIRHQLFETFNRKIDKIKTGLLFLV